MEHACGGNIKMAQIVTGSAVLKCSFAAAPCNLTVTSQTVLLAEGKPVATIQDCQPGVNIPSFGMCSSLANPQVAAATAAALGVLTPQPCSMVPMGTWSMTRPGFMAGGKPVLTSEAGLLCMAGMGNISITFAGQTKVLI